MFKSTLIKKIINSEGYWQFTVVNNNSSTGYYVINISFSGFLTSFCFPTFSEADQYFNSQTKRRELK